MYTGNKKILLRINKSFTLKELESGATKLFLIFDLSNCNLLPYELYSFSITS